MRGHTEKNQARTNCQTCDRGHHKPSRPGDPPGECSCMNEPRQPQQRNPHQTHESWEILKHSCFRPLKFGVVCSTAKANCNRGPSVLAKHLKDIFTIYLHKNLEVLSPLTFSVALRGMNPWQRHTWSLKRGLWLSSREFWVLESHWLDPTASLTRDYIHVARGEQSGVF